MIAIQGTDLTVNSRSTFYTKSKEHQTPYDYLAFKPIKKAQK